MNPIIIATVYHFAWVGKTVEPSSTDRDSRRVCKLVDRVSPLQLMGDHGASRVALQLPASALLPELRPPQPAPVYRLQVRFILLQYERMKTDPALLRSLAVKPVHPASAMASLVRSTVLRTPGRFSQGFPFHHRVPLFFRLRLRS